MVSCTVATEHRNALVTRLKLTASAAEQLEGGLEAPPRKSRGATIGRLLGLARPEYPQGSPAGWRPLRTDSRAEPEVHTPYFRF